MNPLEKIIDEIISEARSRADNLLSEAGIKADGIIKQSEAERGEIKRRYDEETEREILEIMNSSKSSDRQARRLMLLTTRNRIIDDIIEEARIILSGVKYNERFKNVEEGNITHNNSVDAVFDAERQTLRDKAHEALTINE